MTAKITYILVFLGSVYVASGKFVNATNTPKLYFVLISLLVIAAFIAISRKRINLGVLSNKTILWNINIICFLQACYGLCQSLGWLPSNHSKFAITGSFDNPAGFAATLSVGFPIGLFLLIKLKKVGRYLALTGLTVIILSVLLAWSRAGILAIIISSLVFFLLQSNIIRKFRQFRYYKLFPILALVLLIAGAFIFYHHKKDSANGRLLIWEVSSEMIKDKPVFGHGYGAFKAEYMDYQAKYFKDNPASKFEFLADNVKHPFNEFIKVTVEFGLVGWVVILSIILFMLLEIMKSKNEDRELVFSGLASFLVFACFSYPLQYVAVWLLLAFYLSLLLPSKEIEIKNTTISIITRSVIVIACTFSMVHTFSQINAEIKWKTIAVSSLRGNTEEMLPEYEKLFSTSLRQNPFFLYNYGAELNVAGKFDKSVEILTECNKRFNDYDLQMLLADNYYKLGELEKAILTYQHASNMIPCRFLPLYQLFKIYEESGQTNDATKCANEIKNKKVKIPSFTVSSIKAQVEDYLIETPKYVW